MMTEIKILPQRVIFSRLQSLSPSGERLPGIVPNVAVHILTYAQVAFKICTHLYCIQ